MSMISGRSLALVLTSVVYCMVSALSSLADDKTEPAIASAGWQALLERAEPIYSIGNYKDALPLYEQAAQAACTANGAAAAQIHCLRYLADCYCRVNEPEKALAQYERVDALLPVENADERVSNLNDEALCWGLRGDYAKAETLCRQALKLCSERTPEKQSDSKADKQSGTKLDTKSELLWQMARTQAHLGYFEYTRSKYAAAIPYFRDAERLLDESARSDIPASLFRQKMAFAQAGSYYHLRRFDEAYDQFKRMYDLDVRLFGKTDMQTGWAMLALSDCLEKCNQCAQSDNWYRKAIFVFRKFNKDRLSKEFASQSTSEPQLTARINSYIFGNSTTPVDLQDAEEPLCKDSSILVNNHDPRSLYARPFSDAPGRVWLNPMVPQKGIVVAIHGLSLQHSSYDAFARQLADAGFSTVAFDMRGFGTYRQALGAEHLDIDGCMRDLQNVVTAIRADNPDKPLFILGESMGGAIALQFAAQNPKFVDGLIASVPSGKRFKQKKTALKVAIHFLEDKNRPLDVGTDVINQATHNPQVKQAWAGDPNTRSRLSPRELLAFQSMCNRNVEYAKQIDVTPVIIFQGVCDGLVKPEATYDLFRAINCKDKSFVMVGNAEHLIFEEGCCTPAVLKGLVAWMESHPRQQTATIRPVR